MAAEFHSERLGNRFNHSYIPEITKNLLEAQSGDGA